MRSLDHWCVCRLPIIVIVIVICNCNANYSFEDTPRSLQNPLSKKQISRPSGGPPRGGDHPGPSWAHQKRPESNVELTKTYSETQNTHAFHTKTYSMFIIYRKAGGAPLNEVQTGVRAMSGKV